MKKSENFRKLQQIVLTKHRRGLKLNPGLETLMDGYIEQSQENKKQLDEIASEIEEEIVKHNSLLIGD